MVARAVRLHQRNALIQICDLEHSVAVCIVYALHKPRAFAGRKSHFQARYGLVRIAPLECQEPAVTGQRAGFSQAALNVFQATCDLTVRDLDIGLKVAGFLAAVEFTEAVGLCGNGEIS
jgi:hypothetical protein